MFMGTTSLQGLVASAVQGGLKCSTEALPCVGAGARGPSGQGPHLPPPVRCRAPHRQPRRRSRDQGAAWHQLQPWGWPCSAPDGWASLAAGQRFWVHHGMVLQFFQIALALHADLWGQWRLVKLHAGSLA